MSAPDLKRAALAVRAVRHRARDGGLEHPRPLRRHQAGRRLAEADGFCRPLALERRRHIANVVAAYCAEHREAGVEPLTASDRHILEVMLFKLMDWRTGELVHAYSYIAAKAQRAYSTVGLAIAALEALGVLERCRRQRRNEDGEGPPWLQDMNAYRLNLPAALQQWWAARKAGRRARHQRMTTPEDQEIRAAEAEAANADAEAAWSAWEAERAAEAKRADRQARASRVQGPGAAAYRRSLE